MNCITKTPTLITRQLNNETFIVEPATGMCHILNEIGTLIWDAINFVHNENEIIDYVTAFIEETDENVAQDIIDFLNQLVEKELIVKEKIS